MRREFFRSLWSQVIAQKLECLSEISTVKQSMILLFSRSFSRFLRYLAIGTSYDHDFFLWRKGLRLKNLLNTQNIVFRSVENFLEAFEVKLFPKNSSVCQKFRRSDKAWFYFFLGNNLTSKASKKFSTDLKTMFWVFKRFSKRSPLRQRKKIMVIERTDREISRETWNRPWKK